MSERPDLFWGLVIGLVGNLLVSTAFALIEHPEWATYLNPLYILSWIAFVFFCLLLLPRKKKGKRQEVSESKEPEKLETETADSKNNEESQRKKYVNSPLLLEYEMTQQMHNCYGRLSWEIASILIAGSLAMVGFSLQSPLMTKERFIGVSLAVTLVILMWFFLFRRISQLVEIHIARLLQIERELHFHQHTYVHDAQEKRHVVIGGKCYDLSGPTGHRSVCLLMSLLASAVWIIAFLLWL